MGTYTPSGPYTSGAAPGIDAGALNAMETCLVNGGMIYFITPYTLMTNPTIISGNVSSYTGAGVGGIPTSAAAILVNYSFSSSTVGAYANIGPLGATLSQYTTTPFVAISGNYVSGFAIVPLSSHQFSVKANTGNIVLNSWTAIGYIN